MSDAERAPRAVVTGGRPPSAMPQRPTRPENLTEPLTAGLREVAAPAGPIELLEPRRVPLGGLRAMPVLRSLPQRARTLIGAWCFVDSYGPDDVAATGGMRVARHPHTGLATVSWLFEGEIDHLDSAGNAARVRPGEVRLMNAGRGVTHSEFSTPATARLHGAQLWYAFPDRARFAPPSLDSHRPAPVRGEGWEARVLVGELLGDRSPIAVHLPLTAAELRLEPGARLALEVPAGHEHGLLAVTGPVRLDGVEVERAHLAVAGTGRTRLVVEAGDGPVVALLLGGEPLGERIVMWWNFVGRSHDEIVRWREEYQREMGFEPGPGSVAAPGAGERERFGPFPAGRPAPIPAPPIPRARMLPRG